MDRGNLRAAGRGSDLSLFRGTPETDPNKVVLLVHSTMCIYWSLLKSRPVTGPRMTTFFDKNTSAFNLPGKTRRIRRTTTRNWNCALQQEEQEEGLPTSSAALFALPLASSHGRSREPQAGVVVLPETYQQGTPSTDSACGSSSRRASISSTLLSKI